MILDQQAIFSEKQAIVATAASTNIIDRLAGTRVRLGPAGTVAPQDLGVGNPVYIFAQVIQAFNNLTSLIVGVETDDNSGFSSPLVLVRTDAAGRQLSQSTRVEPRPGLVPSHVSGGAYVAKLRKAALKHGIEDPEALEVD